MNSKYFFKFPSHLCKLLCFENLFLQMLNKLNTTKPKNKYIKLTLYLTVPFAVEERSGTITVVADPAHFSRPLYDFEAVVTRTGSPAAPATTILTNVTIHVVDPEDERGVLMK